MKFLTEILAISISIVSATIAFSINPPPKRRNINTIDSPNLRTTMAATTSKDTESTDDSIMLRKYLNRIGIDSGVATAMMEDDNRKPNESDLTLLLQAHLTSVPFENLSQHVHAAFDETKEIPITKLPTLDVKETLQKIVEQNRGGFCWEINTAFAWLLRQLGYSVRFGIGNVLTPDGPIPGHLCLYVDGLTKDGSALHIDPGFGDAPRVPLPVGFGNTVKDSMLGDAYAFVPNDDPSSLKESPEQSERFNAVLVRTRLKGMGNSPMVDLVDMPGVPPPPPEPIPEPVYLLNFDDDLQVDCPEFRDGLDSVLAKNEKNIFSQKRMCVILRKDGFDYVGSSYWKEVRNGAEVSRTVLENEESFRKALDTVAGIRL